MKVKALRSFSGKQGVIPVNSEQDLDKEYAEQLIEKGLVEEVKSNPKKKEK